MVHYIPRICKLSSNSWLSFKLNFSKVIKPCSFNSCKRSNCSISWMRLWFALTLAITFSLFFSYDFFEFTQIFYILKEKLDSRSVDIPRVAASISDSINFNTAVNPNWSISWIDHFPYKTMVKLIELWTWATLDIPFIKNHPKI